MPGTRIRGEPMIETYMPHSAIGRAISYGVVAASSALAFAQSFDSGMIAASIGIVGLAITGVYFEFKRKRREDLKADMEARIEMDRRALEAQIANDERREKAYANTMQQQIARLQESLDEGNRRVEDANKKLHDLRNEAEVAKATFLNDREDLKEQLAQQAEMIARYEAENRRLMMQINGKVDVNRDAIREMKAGSGDDLPATPARPQP